MPRDHDPTRPQADTTRAVEEAGATGARSRRDQMREDYALERLPNTWRWSNSSILMVLVGIITAFFFPATGGSYYLAYGATATWIGMLIAFLVMTVLVMITSSAASREGLTSDLLTRGCGYGYLGSALTSLIYAFTFTLYAALEGQILSSALHSVWPIPMGVYYVVVGLLFIPLTWYGMAQLTWSMWLTLPVYLGLLAYAIVVMVNRNGLPTHVFDGAPSGALVGGLGIIGVMAGLSGTIGLNPMEYADYNRFIKPQRFRRAVLPNIILPNLLMFGVAFPMGIFFTLGTGESDPGVYFVKLLGPALGVLFAWVTQMRINMTNVYSGSLAFSNFFARTVNWTPGRIYFVGLTCVLSVALMFGNVLGHLLAFLVWDGIFLISWVGTVVADLLIVKRMLKIGPDYIEYTKEKLWSVNPVGVVALVAGVVVGSALHYGAANAYLQNLAPYVSLVVAMAVHTLMAVVTRGRYYLKPEAPSSAVQAESVPSEV